MGSFHVTSLTTQQASLTQKVAEALECIGIMMDHSRGEEVGKTITL